MQHHATTMNYKHLPVAGDEVILKDGRRFIVHEGKSGWFLKSSKTDKILMEVGKQSSQLEFFKHIVSENNRR
jgi:hypothetical protein